MPQSRDHGGYAFLEPSIIFLTGRESRRPHIATEMDSWRDEQPGDDHALLESNDMIVSRLAQKDKLPWYNKPNLRLLYLLMALTCLGVEVTSG